MNPDPKNPFSDAFNPYQAPTWQASAGPLMAFTREQARLRLLGPAIGLSVASILWLCYIGFVMVMFVLEEPVWEREVSFAENVGRCIGLLIVLAVAFVPSFVAIVGAIGMLRVKGYWWAMIGAIAGVLPCSFCFPLALPFGVWGIVTLYDRRIHAAFQTDVSPFR